MAGRFDELNILPIEEYFESMELSREEKEKRKQLAYAISGIMLFVFSLYGTMKEFKRISKQFIISQLVERYSEEVLKHMAVDQYISGYISEFSKEVVETTIKHDGEEFFTSNERALLIGENEAMTMAGYSELQRAIKSGYTKKRWITEKDNKVRQTHREVDDLVLPIMTPFVVGNSLMMYAHDGITFNADVSELSNCRCVTVYEK